MVNILDIYLYTELNLTGGLLYLYVWLIHKTCSCRHYILNVM